MHVACLRDVHISHDAAKLSIFTTSGKSRVPALDRLLRTTLAWAGTVAQLDWWNAPIVMLFLETETADAFQSRRRHAGWIGSTSLASACYPSGICYDLVE
jgi:hypothetical protein